MHALNQPHPHYEPGDEGPCEEYPHEFVLALVGDVVCHDVPDVHELALGHAMQVKEVEEA